MSAANYAHCPFCDQKALYVGEEDLPENVTVVHESCLDAQVAKTTIEVKRLRLEAREWEYLAGLAFAYYDAPDGTDDVNHAWYELKAAIEHWRATGGREPRDPDEICPPPEQWTAAEESTSFVEDDTRARRRVD